MPDIQIIVIVFDIGISGGWKRSELESKIYMDVRT